MYSALKSLLNKEPNYGKIAQICMDLNRLLSKLKSTNSIVSKSLDDCETISQEDILEIKKLEDIQELMKDKKGKKTIRDKISSALKWVADKGTDAMIALLPTLVMVLTNLQVA